MKETLHQWTKRIIFNRFNKSKYSESKDRGSDDRVEKKETKIILEKEEFKKEPFDNDLEEQTLALHSKREDNSESEDSLIIHEAIDNEYESDSLHEKENTVDMNEQSANANQNEVDHFSSYVISYDDSHFISKVDEGTEGSEKEKVNNNSTNSNSDDLLDQDERIEVEDEDPLFYDDPIEEDSELEIILEKEESKKEPFDNELENLTLDFHSKRENNSDAEDSLVIHEGVDNEYESDSLHEKEKIVDMNERSAKENQNEEEADNFSSYVTSDDDSPFIAKADEGIESSEKEIANENAASSNDDNFPVQEEYIEIETEEKRNELIVQVVVDEDLVEKENRIDMDEPFEKINEIEEEVNDEVIEESEMETTNKSFVYSNDDDISDQEEFIEVEAEESSFYEDTNEEDDEIEEPDFQSMFQKYVNEVVSTGIVENSVEVEDIKISRDKKRSLSEEEVEEEKIYLKDTITHISRMPQKEWIMEFNQSEDPNHILWKRMIDRGTVDQSANYEEKRDRYIDQRKTKLLNKPYSTAISLMKDDDLQKYYIGNRDVYSYKGNNRERQIVYHEHSPIGERYLEFHGMPDKSGEEFEDILEVINFTIKNRELAKDPQIEFSRINGEAREDFDPLLDQIEANRNNYSAHDIFSTIRLTQTSIVKAPIDKPSLIYGCAGSGKTILMFYRISRAKYQAKYSRLKKPLKMENFALITPTDLLRNYNDSIIQEREISGIRQITPPELIRDALEEYYFGSNIQISKKLELGFNKEEERIRDEYALETAETIFQTVFSLLNDDNGVLTKDIKKLNMKIRSFELNLGYRWKTDFNFLINTSQSSFNEVKKQWIKISKTDLEEARKQLEKEIHSIGKRLNYFDFLIKLGSVYEFEEQNSKKFEKEYQSLKIKGLEDIDKILEFIDQGFQENQDQNESLLNEDPYEEKGDKTIIEYIKERNPELLSLSYRQILWILDLKKKITKILKDLETEKSFIEILLKKEKWEEKSTDIKAPANWI